MTPRHSCEYAEAEIRRPGGSNVFGHETPALAPLRCATAAIWLVLRQPVERLLSRLYKPREKRCAQARRVPAAVLRRERAPHRPIRRRRRLLGAFASNLTSQNQMKFDAKEVGRDSRAGTGEFLGAISLNEPYTRALLGPEAVLRPLGSVSEADLVAAKAVLDSLDVVMPMWAMEMAPFALGLPAHVLGPAYRITRSHSTASAGEVPPALIAELERRNRLDVQLYAHATHMHRARVGRAAQQLWPPPPRPPPRRRRRAVRRRSSCAPPPTLPTRCTRSPAAGRRSRRAARRADGAIRQQVRGGGVPGGGARRAGCRRTGRGGCCSTWRKARAAPGWSTACSPSADADGALPTDGDGADAAAERDGAAAPHARCRRSSCTGSTTRTTSPATSPCRRWRSCSWTRTRREAAAVLRLDPWAGRCRASTATRRVTSRRARLTDDFSYVRCPCVAPGVRRPRAPRARDGGAEVRRRPRHRSADGAGDARRRQRRASTRIRRPAARRRRRSRATPPRRSTCSPTTRGRSASRRRRVPLFAANLAEDMFYAGRPRPRRRAPAAQRSAPCAARLLFDAFSAFVDATTGHARARVG